MICRKLVSLLTNTFLSFVYKHIPSRKSSSVRRSVEHCYVYLRTSTRKRPDNIRMRLYIICLLLYYRSLKTEMAVSRANKVSAPDFDPSVSMARPRSSLGPDRRRGGPVRRVRFPRKRANIRRILGRSSRRAEDGTDTELQWTRSRRASETNVAFLERLAPSLCSAGLGTRQRLLFSAVRDGGNKSPNHAENTFHVGTLCVCTDGLERSFVKYSYHLSFGGVPSALGERDRRSEPETYTETHVAGNAPEILRTRAEKRYTIRKTHDWTKEAWLYKTPRNTAAFFIQRSITFERYTYNSHSIDDNNRCTRCNGPKRFNVFLARECRGFNVFLTWKYRGFNVFEK